MFKVMIVDDMEVMRRQIKRLPLWGESTGFFIIEEAEDGEEALCKLQRQPVDLLITDIKMPRINGIELLKEVNKESLAKCVVFLSEHSEFNFAKEAIQYGIFDYLVKPVKSEELKGLLLKVHNHLKEKEEAQIQIKNLEDKLLEKMEVYFPTTQLNLTIQYILEGNRKALEALSSIVEDTSKALEGDRVKTAIVLQKSYGEIWREIKANYEWIDTLINIRPYIDINLTQYSEIDIMHSKLMEMLEEILVVINRFIFNSRRNPIIKEICEYVIRNIEKEISIGKISETFFLTKNYIGDIFKQETTMTLGEYITMVKMERAKKLVNEGDLKNYEIAEKLGYDNAEYFTKLFKKYSGLSPMEYKNISKSK